MAQQHCVSEQAYKAYKQYTDYPATSLNKV